MQERWIRRTGAAAFACKGCRRLKMRCVGAENPPCTRCSKSGRECIVLLPNRHNSHASDRPRTSTNPQNIQGLDNQSSNNAPSATNQRISESQIREYRLARKQGQEHRISPSGTSQRPFGMPSPQSSTSTFNWPQSLDLPSIFSTSAMTATSPCTSNISTHNSHAGESNTPGHLDPSENGHAQNHVAQVLFDSRLADMIQLFRRKNIYFVPMLLEADVEDVGNLLGRRRPLAYCLAFVAGRFIPGYDSIREQLRPLVLQFVNGIVYLPSRSDDENWMLLQALAVLYAYVQIPKSSASLIDPSRSDNCLDHWILKSKVETFALQLSLHRSIEEVKILLRNDCPDITSKVCYRNSIYWLWLFTLSHHHSLITRTPPSIRLDSTISSSLEILKRLPNDPSILRVLAEVDLCILWSQLSCREKGLGEWWCPPPERRDVKEILCLLEDADAALRKWSENWTRIQNQTVSDSGDTETSATEFHYRATRFCISTFATLIAHDQSIDIPAEDLPAITQAVLKSTDAACSCCNFLLELGALQKEGLRYSPDFTFTMISFCCLYIIHAHKLLGRDHPSLVSHIEKVRQVASLMEDLSVGQNQCPRLYGESILARLPSASGNHSSRGSVRHGLSQGLDIPIQCAPDDSFPESVRAHSEALPQYSHEEQAWSRPYQDAGTGHRTFSLPDDSFNAGYNLFDDYEIDYSFILDHSFDFGLQS